MHGGHGALASKQRTGSKHIKIEMNFATLRSAVTTNVLLAERFGTCARKRTGAFVSNGLGSLLFPLSSLLLKRLPLIDNPASIFRQETMHGKTDLLFQRGWRF